MKGDASSGSRSYLGAIAAALLIGLAVAGWWKLTTVSSRAVQVEDRFEPGTRLGGGLYEQPLQF